MQWKAYGVFELDFITILTTQMTTLSKQIGKMNVNAIQTNVVWLLYRKSLKYQLPNEKPFVQPNSKEVNYLSNLQCQNDPHSNTFNPRWRNYPNFSWSTNQGAAKPT